MSDYEYTLFSITRTGDTFELKPHESADSDGSLYGNEVRYPDGLARGMAMTLLYNCLEDYSPTGEVPSSDDFLDNLEVEMANDAVAEGVDSQRGLQDMTAARILTAIFEDDRSEADATELENLAFWFNRRRQAIPRLDLPNDAEHLLGYACHCTITALLDATLAD